MSTGANEKDPHDKETGGGETVPDSNEGVGLGAGKEPSTFEPEEDPEAELGHS